MSLSIGIVGLPNVGKSTLFKALTKSYVEAENYPFCTIDPNIGIVNVPDERLNVLAQISKSQQIIPTTIKFVDIAGLVKNAHQGEGLGNKFLAHIREVDAIAQVVRAFTDENIVHVHGNIDPKNDIEIINTELILADLDLVERKISELEKKVKTSVDKLLKKFFEVLLKLQKNLQQGILANKIDFDEEELGLIKQLNLLTLKPFFFILNVSENDLAKEIVLENINSEFVIPLCVKLEAELSELDDAEALEFLKELGLKERGLDRVIKVGYSILNLITFFTSGQKETRAWTIIKGTKAPQAAGKIHSDFEKHFIKAEVIKFEDFVKYKGELGAKQAGVCYLQGKDYIVEDGDVIHFKVGV